MSIYSIASELFERFPEYSRGVLIANGIDNSSSGEGTAELLSREVVENAPRLVVPSDPRITAWEQAFREVGINPKKYTPSIVFLANQIQKGRPVRPINPIVDLFNVVSLAWGAPCGGDDLSALTGEDIRLGFARGDEQFSPLFKPEVSDPPAPGEVIYYARQTGRVMCRRWTWRNADFSKISPSTRRVAINIDMFAPPSAGEDLGKAMAQLGRLINRFCGGSVSIHVLDRDNPSFEFGGSGGL